MVLSDIPDGGAPASSDEESGSSPALSAPLTRQMTALYQKLSDKRIRYNEVFYTYIEQGRYYFGCDPILSASSESRIEDFLLHVGCNDHLFSCVFAVKGLKYSKNGRRIVYILQHSMSFLLLAFVDTFFAFLTTNIAAMPYIVKYAIPLCVIMPASIMFGAIIKKMYTFTSDLRGVSPGRRRFLKILGRVSIIPLFLSVSVTLILAAMLTYSENKTGIIFEFGIKVHVVSVLAELTLVRLQYMQSRHTHLYVRAFGMRLSVFKVGAILCELIHKHPHLRREYSVSSRSCCCGVFNMDSITKRRAQAEAPRAEVEMAGEADRSSLITMQDNPLLALERKEPSHAPILGRPPPPPVVAAADNEMDTGLEAPYTAAEEGEAMREARARKVLRELAAPLTIKRKTLENRRMSFVNAFRNIEGFIEKNTMEAAPRVYEYEYEAPAGESSSSDADVQRLLAGLRLSDIDSSIAEMERRAGSSTAEAVVVEEPPAEVLQPAMVDTPAMDVRTGIRRGSVAELARAFER
jgi:hypothetical protein